MGPGLRCSPHLLETGGAAKKDPVAEQGRRTEKLARSGRHHQIKLLNVGIKKLVEKQKVAAASKIRETFGTTVLALEARRCILLPGEGRRLIGE
jgi:hypothetical protein